MPLPRPRFRFLPQPGPWSRSSSRASSWSRPHRHDVLIALAGLAGGLVLWGLGLYNNEQNAERVGTDWVLLPLALMCVAAAGRRSAQPWSLTLAVLALAGDMASGSLLATVIVFTDVLYGAVLYGSERIARAALPASVVLTVGLTVGLLKVYSVTETLSLGSICIAVFIAPAWTGAIVRNHRSTAAAERLRAEQTALLAEMDRAQAVTSERARMARELHDVVANHLSAIAIHSTAALSSEEPNAPRDALGVIRENSVRGLSEMRRLIGLLRGPADADEDEPQASPTLDGLDALLAGAQARTRDRGLTHSRARTGTGTGPRTRTRTDEGGYGAGLTFHLVDDRKPGGGTALPSPVELAAYRVVQESVTNALKHAAPGDVTVQLTQDTGAPLTVRVTSPLDGDQAPPPRAPGAGAGLTGMRERVALLGGTLHAAPKDRLTWEVRAELPIDERGPR